MRFDDGVVRGSEASAITPARSASSAPIKPVERGKGFGFDPR
jgi:hypothetical protein